jgi:hypothetical protein
LTGKTIETAIKLIREQRYDNEASAIRSFESSLSLQPGDYVGINNTNHGLFRVGKILSPTNIRLVSMIAIRQNSTRIISK